MAEVTSLRHNALPYPVYGAPWGVVFPMFDADGDLVTGASTPDAEVSKNGDTFADCTNESTEIATNSGMYYLLLTATEMTADVVAVIAKSATSGMKTTPLVLYPRKLVTVRSGTSAGGTSSTITLDSGASAVDDYYNGMVCIATLDSVVEVRIIGDYVGSTKVATIEGPNWNNAAPDSDDTFVIKLPEGARIGGADVLAYGGTAGTFSGGRPEVNTSHIAGSAVSTSTAQIGVNVVNFGGSAGTFSSGRPEVNTTHAAGTAWGSGAITAGSIATGAITNAKFAAGAIDAAAVADNAIDAGAIATGAITAAKFAAGAIDAAAIAADAIGASELASDAATEIATAVWASATRILTAGTNIVLAKGTGVTGFNDLDAAGVRTAVGLASANLDTQIGTLATASNLATVAGYVDTEIAAIIATLGTPAGASVSADIAAAKVDTAAIKAKTDQLAFGATNTVNANITYVNEVAVSGAGTEADPWGP